MVLRYSCVVLIGWVGVQCICGCASVCISDCGSVCVLYAFCVCVVCGEMRCPAVSVCNIIGYVCYGVGVGGVFCCVFVDIGVFGDAELCVCVSRVTGCGLFFVCYSLFVCGVGRGVLNCMPVCCRM